MGPQSRLPEGPHPKNWQRMKTHPPSPGFVMHTGGRRFSPRRLRPPGAEWAFWQPGLGGWVFILCQFFGWGLFVASLVALAWMARALASGFAVGFRTFGM